LLCWYAGEYCVLIVKVAGAQSPAVCERAIMSANDPG
jgi:hypothetical protein